MDNKNPMNLSIEIINPGNGEPGISPCAYVDIGDGGGGGCGKIFACHSGYMPVCTSFLNP